MSPAQPARQQHYDELLAYADGSVNSAWFAQIIASWLSGDGALPDHLGLPPSQFQDLLSCCFPGVEAVEKAGPGRTPDFSRMLEKQDLEQLLRHFAAKHMPETEWFISIIVAACLGNDHLWQDLGLWSRTDLSDLLKHNFPDLAANNSHDMKWKKFLYKQLCEQEGLFVCRAPSCAVCKDYQQCFGAED